MNVLLLVHVAATLFLTGLIWFVQAVHYPLFAQVGSQGYAAYQSEHMSRTTRVVALPMVVELLAAVALLWLAPAQVPPILPRAGALLLAVIWLSTALLQVPAHDRLTAGWDAAHGKRLVGSNWVRTVAWSIRSMLALGMLAAVM